MKTAKVKARYFECYDNKTFKIKTYVELPADAESVERMVEQMAQAMCEEDHDDAHATLSRQEDWRADHYRDMARAALAAIGINAKGNK